MDHDSLRHQARDAGQDVHDSARGGWLHRLGQVGFAAHGLVWFVVGWIAMGLALGSRSSDDATTTGAIEEIGSTLLGAALLIVMVLGLLCYVAWQAVLTVLGHPDEHGRSDAVRRISSAVKAVVALTFAVTGVLVLWRGSAGSGGSEEQGAQTLLSSPGGQLLLGAVGLAIVGLGAWWIWTGYSERFAKKLDAGVSRRVVTAGRIGHAARGFAFIVLGGLVVLAAVRSDADQAGGTDSALATILGWPAGPLLVGIVAAGLMLFGIFHVLAARHVVKD